jgi:hypothetical protein
MKLYIEKTPMTEKEAEAAQTKTKRLCTASQYFKIPKDQWEKEIYPHTPLRIEDGLLARDGYVGFDGVRRVVVVRRPSGRVGVLYVIDEEPCKHTFEKQPDKCKDCGEVRA